MTTKRPGSPSWIALTGVWVVLMGPMSARGDLPIEQEPIQYSKSLADDPMARLQKRIDRGEVTLRFDEDGQGYLKSVLEALEIHPDSQTLVFSKTSFQHTR